MTDIDQQLKNELITALLDCQNIQDKQSRDTIVSNLRPEIRNNLIDSPKAIIHVNNIINTCLNYPNGLSDFIEQLRHFEGDSIPMQKVVAVYQETVNHLPSIQENSENDSSMSRSPVTQVNRARRVFISYRHINPDEDLAKHLVQSLENRGHSVFIDNRMLVGTNWVNDIEKHITAADAFIVLISEQSIRSEMVRAEVKLAAEMVKQNNQYKILPIRIAYDGALPYDLAAHLNNYQYTLWQSSESYDKIVKQVALSLEADQQLPFQQNTTQKGLNQLQKLLDDGSAPLTQTDPMLAKEVLIEAGTMKADSKYYVERSSDAEMFSNLDNQSQSTILVRGARQMGKSSCFPE